MRCRVPPPLFTPVRPFPISPSIPHSPPHFPHTPFPITPHFPTPHFPEPPPFPITPHVPPPPVSPITPRSPTPLPPNVGGRAIKVGVFIASCFCCGGFFWGGGAGLVGGGGGAQWGADGWTHRNSHWLLTGRGRGLTLPFSPLVSDTEGAGPGSSLRLPLDSDSGRGACLGSSLPLPPIGQ